MPEELPWFRLYSEFATDPSVQILAFEDQRHFVMAMCAKRKGILDKEYGTPELRMRVISAFLGLDPIACAEANRRLREMKLVDEEWHPTNWERRQYSSDTSAERTRKWRERQRCDVTETSQRRHCDGTDSDTDSEAKASRTRAHAHARDEGEDLENSMASSGDPAAPDRPTTALRHRDQHANPIHDWRRVPGIDHEAMSAWFTYLDQAHKRISPATAVSMAKSLAITGPPEHQRALVDFHREKGWMNIRKYGPTELAAEINARDNPAGQRRAVTPDKPGKFESMMEEIDRE